MLQTKENLEIEKMSDENVSFPSYLVVFIRFIWQSNIQLKHSKNAIYLPLFEENNSPFSQHFFHLLMCIQVVLVAVDFWDSIEIIFSQFMFFWRWFARFISHGFYGTALLSASQLQIRNKVHFFFVYFVHVSIAPHDARCFGFIRIN